VRITLESGLEGRARAVVDMCVEYLGECALSIESGYRRVNGGSNISINGNYYSGGIGYGHGGSYDYVPGGAGAGGRGMGGQNGKRKFGRSTTTSVSSAGAMEVDIPNSNSQRLFHRSATIATGGNVPDRHPSRPSQPSRPQDQSPREENPNIHYDEAEENDVSVLNTTHESLETTAVPAPASLPVDTSIDLTAEENPIFNVNDISIQSSVHTHSSVASEECKFDPEAASTSKSRSGTGMGIGLGIGNTNNNNNNEDGTTAMIPTGMDESSEFDPEAASASKSRDGYGDSKLSSRKNPSESESTSTTMTPAQQLGLLGARDEGLFLLLHADDVHKSSEVTKALRILYLSHPRHSERSLDSISTKIAHLFKSPYDIGDLIVWGTQELMDELGPVLSSCWKDGDSMACTRFGALILEKAKILSGFDLVVSIKTRKELCHEIRLAAVQNFLNLMSASCDVLCRLVSVGLGAKQSEIDMDTDDTDTDIDIGVCKTVNDVSSEIVINQETSACCSPSSHPNSNTNINTALTLHKGSHSLFSMLQSDLKLPRRIAKSWHDLLLTLLAVPNFKAALANAYVDTYNHITGEYANGIGIFEKSSYTLSVQFLNRVAYVEDLVKERDLLGCLVRSLFDTLSVAIKNKSKTKNDAASSMEEASSVGHNSLSLIGSGHSRNSSAAWTINMIHDVLDDYLNPLGPRSTAQWAGLGLFSGNDEENEAEQQMLNQLNQTRFNPVLDPMHSVLSNRRYGPCISDLKCVLNVPGVARLFSSLPVRTSKRMEEFNFQKPCLLDSWINILSLGQNIDGQRWRN